MKKRKFSDKCEILQKEKIEMNAEMLQVAKNFFIVFGVMSGIFTFVGIAGILFLQLADKVEQKHKRKTKEFHENEG